MWVDLILVWFVLEIQDSSTRSSIWEWQSTNIQNGHIILIIPFQDSESWFTALYIPWEIINRKLVNLIYKALVKSLLRYGITAWGGRYKTNFWPVQKVQNYFTKTWILLFKLYDEEIMNIQQLYILSACTYSTV